MRKLVGKHRFCSYKVEKFEDVSHERLVSRLQHVSSRGVAVSMGEAAKPLLFAGLVSKQIPSLGVAGVAFRDIFTCLQMVSKVVLCACHFCKVFRR